MILSEKLDKFLPLPGLLVFACIAGYGITMPGLYYDEALFVNAALGGKIDMFIALRLGDLPVMLMPYIGALKAWIYYPVFKLFDVTACSVRWPVVAVGVLTLWVNYKWVEAAFSRRAAILFLVLAAVEPSTIFHTRLDWGPTALMMLFRGLLLLAVFCWLRQRKTWMLGAAVLFSILGVFDKLNFVWLVSSSFMALLLVYPDRVSDFMKSHRRVVYVSGLLGAALAAGLILYGIHFISQMGEILPPDWSERWTYLTQNMLRPTLGGASVYGFIIGSNRDILSPQLMALGAAALAAIGVLISTKPAPGEWRTMGFILCVIILILLQMFIIRKAGGPHHAAMLAPLWLVPLAVWLGRAFDPSRGGGPILKGIALAAVAVVVISSLLVDAAYLRGFQTQSLNPRWSMASYALVDELKTKSDRPVVCVDWGFGTTVYALMQGKATVYDFWPRFKDGLTPSDIKHFEDELLNQKPLFVTYTAGKETFPETRKNFFDIAAQRNWKLDRIKVINDQNHQAVIEVYEAGKKTGI